MAFDSLRREGSLSAAEGCMAQAYPPVHFFHCASWAHLFTEVSQLSCILKGGISHNSNPQSMIAKSDLKMLRNAGSAI